MKVEKRTGESVTKKATTALARVRKAAVVVAAGVSMAFVGTTAYIGYGSLGLGGGPSSASGTEGGAAVGAPNTPTLTVTPFADTGDSARVVTSAFVGSGADTHDSTQIQMDTVTGNFSSPQYHDVSLGAVLTDTVPAIDSGAVVITRARHKGASGGWSNWSATDTTTMITGVPADAVFISDWSTATGTSSSALLDDGKARPWTTNGLPGTREVIATADSSLDFPSTNVLRVDNDGAVNLMFTKSDGYIDSLSTNDCLYVRHYRRSFLNGGSSGGEHGTYFDDSTTPTNWGPNTFGYNDAFANASGYRHNLSTGSIGSPAAVTDPNERYWEPPATLLNDKTYRYETRICRRGNVTFDIAHRVYDHAGDSLLYSTENGDFFGRNLTSARLDTITFTQDAASRLESLRGFRTGLEGVNGTSNLAFYLCCFMIRTDDWPGPYSAAEANGTG